MGVWGLKPQPLKEPGWGAIVMNGVAAVGLLACGFLTLDGQGFTFPEFWNVAVLTEWC